MYSIIPLGIIGSLCAVLLTLYRRFTKDLENAKKTGLVCIPSRKYNWTFLLLELGILLHIFCHQDKVRTWCSASDSKGAGRGVVSISSNH